MSADTHAGGNGSDYPHDEGTPFTREHLRLLIHATPESTLRAFLAGNAAQRYEFDLDALQPLRDRFGPSVDEIATGLERPDEALLEAAV